MHTHAQGRQHAVVGKRRLVGHFEHVSICNNRITPGLRSLSPSRIRSTTDHGDHSKLTPKLPPRRIPQAAKLAPDSRRHLTSIQSAASEVPSRSPFPHCHFDHDASFQTHRTQGPSPAVALPVGGPTQDLASLSTFLHFRHMLQLPDASIDPLHCALLVARVSHDFSVLACRDAVAVMAQEVERKLSEPHRGPATDEGKLQAINEVLYQDHGFRPLHDQHSSSPSSRGMPAWSSSPDAAAGRLSPGGTRRPRTRPTLLRVAACSSEATSQGSWGWEQEPQEAQEAQEAQASTCSMYHPDSHHLNTVLDRRTGSPTSMAVLYLALADAVGLRLEPVLLRSHMFLAPQGEQGTHVVDPYAYGVLRTRADVARTLAANEVFVAGCLEGETGGGPGATPWPIARRADIVLRLLLNLRESYWAPVLRCQCSAPDPQQRTKQVERALVLLRFARSVGAEGAVGSDHHPGLMCDEGLALMMLGREDEGLPLLSDYLNRCPDSEEATMVRQMLVHFSRSC